MLATKKYNKYHRDSYVGKKCVFENPLGFGKSQEDKKFYEKNITAEISDVRDGCGYIGITLTIDLK